jgi:hypothetical protein
MHNAPRRANAVNAFEAVLFRDRKPLRSATSNGTSIGNIGATPGTETGNGRASNHRTTQEPHP